MKSLLFILIIFPFLVKGQTFNLTDTTFKSGQFLRTYQIQFELNKYELNQESKIYLDGISTFLKKNKNLTIEVGNHCDTHYSKQSSTKLTELRAETIVNYLVSKDVNADRLLAKGYNNTKPIIPAVQIVTMKTREEIENVHHTNRRTEFKILRTDYK